MSGTGTLGCVHGSTRESSRVFGARGQAGAGRGGGAPRQRVGRIFAPFHWLMGPVRCGSGLAVSWTGVSVVVWRFEC